MDGGCSSSCLIALTTWPMKTGSRVPCWSMRTLSSSTLGSPHSSLAARPRSREHYNVPYVLIRTKAAPRGLAPCMCVGLWTNICGCWGGRILHANHLWSTHFCSLDSCGPGDIDDNIDEPVAMYWFISPDFCQGSLWVCPGDINKPPGKCQYISEFCPGSLSSTVLVIWMNR